MRFKLFNTLIICVMCIAMVGCSSQDVSKVSQTMSEEESLLSGEYYISWGTSGTKYKVKEGEEYIENQDGTYTLCGKTFKYKLLIETDTDNDFSHILLSNTLDVTSKDIMNSALKPDYDKEPEWVTIGWTKDGYVENEDGTYTLGANTYKYKQVVSGSENDSKTVSSYRVLTNAPDVTYKEIANGNDEERFVAIDYWQYGVLK